MSQIKPGDSVIIGNNKQVLKVLQRAKNKEDWELIDDKEGVYVIPEGYLTIVKPEPPRDMQFEPDYPAIP